MEPREIGMICFSIVAPAILLGGAVLINREDAREDAYIDYLPKKVKCAKVKIDRKGIKKEENLAINEFISTFDKEGLELSGFYKNINASKIIYSPKTEGYYDALEKNIVIDPNNIRSSLLRALLEMSATYTFSYLSTQTIVASGFERSVYDKDYWPSRKYYIGYGLSQGYKDILLKRFFGIEGCYPLLSELATLIEDLVGTETMQRYFMTGDLANLRSNLYNSLLYRYRDGVACIVKMDDLYDAMYLDNPFKKIGIESTYRGLIVELSKRAISKVRELYYESWKVYQARDNSGAPSMGSPVETILEHVNTILENRKKCPLLLGIKPKDISEIAEYSHKEFINMPKKYHI